MHRLGERVPAARRWRPQRTGGRDSESAGRHGAGVCAARHRHAGGVVNLHPVIAELRRERRTAGVSLKTLSERTGGMAIPNVSAILLGKRDLKLSTLTRLAGALGYKVTPTPIDADDGAAQE